MKKWESFTDFKSRFLDKAIKGLVSESEWFFYMWSKITPELQAIARPAKLSWKGKHQKMIRHLTSIDSDRRRETVSSSSSKSSFRKTVSAT
jgi:hypothetical protein